MSEPFVEDVGLPSERVKARAAEVNLRDQVIAMLALRRKNQGTGLEEPLTDLAIASRLNVRPREVAAIRAEVAEAARLAETAALATPEGPVRVVEEYVGTADGIRDVLGGDNRPTPAIVAEPAEAVPEKPKRKRRKKGEPVTTLGPEEAAWTMTAAEYVASIFGTPEADGATKEELRAEHLAHVRRALKEGWDVPPRVFASCPELVPAAEPAVVPEPAEATPEKPKRHRPNQRQRKKKAEAAVGAERPVESPSVQTTETLTAPAEDAQSPWCCEHCADQGGFWELGNSESGQGTCPVCGRVAPPRTQDDAEDLAEPLKGVTCSIAEQAGYDRDARKVECEYLLWQLRGWEQVAAREPKLRPLAAAITDIRRFVENRLGGAPDAELERLDATAQTSSIILRLAAWEGQALAHPPTHALATYVRAIRQAEETLFTGATP